ncbi:FAD-dependent oxidoreductase [Rhodococcus koreensis]
MTHVITQPCCNDASCVSVCPVNCIHPTPDEPGFATAEMLYIDPDTCIDCAACILECPVEAIVADDEIDESQERYLQINADYYRDHDVDTAPFERVGKIPVPEGRRLTVAIVGAGPSAFYAAEELLRYPEIRVDMFDRLPTPYGLVRAGVAPDHLSTKGVEKTFAATAKNANFAYYLNIEVGKHISVDELHERYGAVVYAHGASADRRLSIDGEDLPGSISATDFVAWYNGHPDHADVEFDLSGRRAVVVGNGNVALDVARVLLSGADRMERTDIAEHALEALRDSKVEEVVILARRGVAHAAYTNSEFLAITALPGVDVVIDPRELALDDDTQRARDVGILDSTVSTKIALAEEFAGLQTTPGNKRVVFRYLVAPRALTGNGRVDEVVCTRNEYVRLGGGTAVAPTGEEFTLSAGLVMRAVGYTGRPLLDVPFDPDRGIVPNDAGRVLESSGGAVVPGAYVTGWIKRGASGGIGMNRQCGQETARAVIADFTSGAIGEPTTKDDLAELLVLRGARRVDDAGWKKIDTAERTAGRASRRQRVKLVRLEDLEIAAQ